MKLFKNYGTILLLVAVSLRCGTEIGNPSIDNVDFQSASANEVTGYIANTGSLTFAPTSGKLARLQTTSQNVSSFKNAPLLKVLSDGTLEPAITVNQTGKLPRVIRLAKASNNRTYVLFNSNLDIAGQFCRLIEIDTENKLRCIDSPSHPAFVEGPNYLLDQETDKKNFLVTVSSTHDDVVIYKSQNSTVDFMTRFTLAQRDGASTTLISEPTVSYERVQQLNPLMQGTIVGFMCYFQSSGIYTPHCLIQNGQTTNLSTELNDTTPENRAFPLREDKVLISSDSISVPLNWRSGPAGIQVNTTNYTVDYGPGLDSGGGYNASPYDFVYQHTDGEIFTLYVGEDADIYDGYMNRLALNPGPYATFLGYIPKAFEASAGERGIASGTKVSDPTNTDVVIIDPLTFSRQKLSPRLDIEVIAARNIATAKAMMAGPSLADRTIFKYYLYDFNTNTATLLFTSTEFVDLHTL